MGKEDILNTKITILKEYYKNRDLMLVGFNDLQGVNTTPFFRKGILEYLKSELEDLENRLNVINAFSLMFNKTEHINYLLSSNLRFDQIRYLQFYGMISALEKSMKDFCLPVFLGKIGYVSKHLYNSTIDDCSLRLSTELKNSKECIIVYSFGSNDLMSDALNNHFHIVRNYKKQNEAYKYAIDKLSNISTIQKKVIGSVEENFVNILSINDKVDIFALGLYVPKYMQRDDMEIFSNAVKIYNQLLIDLCKEYDIEYIDTQEITDKNKKSKRNIRVSTIVQKEIANRIIDSLYERKINKGSVSRKQYDNNFKPKNYGVYEFLVNLRNDFLNIEYQMTQMHGYEKEVARLKLKELSRKIDVAEKVLWKR